MRPVQSSAKRDAARYAATISLRLATMGSSCLICLGLTWTTAGRPALSFAARAEIEMRSGGKRSKYSFGTYQGLWGVTIPHARNKGFDCGFARNAPAHPATC